jgi:aerobic carbon-monoxide dehydrogenase large subunit
MVEPGMVFAAFVRSDYAQARLESVDLSHALTQPGVLGILDAAALTQLQGVLPRMPPSNPAQAPIQLAPMELLASATVQFVGQAIAVVLAHSAEQAASAAALIAVNYSESDTPTKLGAPVAQLTLGAARVVPAAPSDITVSVTIAQEKVYAYPMEPRAALMQFDARSATLKAWLGTQAPSRAQADLAQTLALPHAQVHVIAPDVGGAFGAKASLTPEEHVLGLCAKWLAQKTNTTANVKWTASRSEDFLASMHGRGAKLRGSLHCDANGKLTHLEAHVTSPLGAWQAFSSAVPMANSLRILPGPYALNSVHLQALAFAEPVTAVNIYRGAGRPEAAVLMERLIDQAAYALKRDPLEFRQRNLIPANAFPFTTPSAQVLDSGDYLLLTQQCADQFDYASRRRTQAAQHPHTELIGIGMALYLEPSGQGWESARVTLNADGSVVVASGSATQGQGHEESYAALASQVLGCEVQQVTVLQGDTQTCPPGIGALASRSTAIGGSAVWQAAQEVAQLRAQGHTLPISASARYTASGETWGSGCVMAQVRVERDTGSLHIDQLCWVDDAGRIISPHLVKGQLWGGLAQGLGQAMMERLVFDENAQLLTGSLMDYALPRASDMPPVNLSSIQTTTKANLIGAKGVGEAGCIGIPAAILNATIDALRPLGIATLDFPLTPARLWRAMNPNDHD